MNVLVHRRGVILPPVAFMWPRWTSMSASETLPSVNSLHPIAYCSAAKSLSFSGRFGKEDSALVLRNKTLVEGAVAVYPLGLCDVQ